jgi:hypothetical protein
MQRGRALSDLPLTETMASLRHLSTGTTRLLEPNHIVGRGLTCNLRLAPMYVSAQHAVLRWAQRRWELRDLGSSNGTWLNGERLKAGERHSVSKGARMAFGSLDDPWEMVDAAHPRAMAVPIDGGDPVVMEGDFLALPSPEDPAVTIYSAKPGMGAELGWLLEESNHSVVPIANMQVFECGGRAWRFSFTEETETVRIQDPPELTLHHIHLVFTVSRDETRVHVQMHVGGRTIDLGARAHHFLLVTLARQRLADRAEEHGEAACGWIDHEDLSHDPRMSTPQLNIDVFRIRKQFEMAGVRDAVGVIERRPMSRQLRIGVERLTVVRE